MSRLPCLLMMLLVACMPLTAGAGAAITLAELRALAEAGKHEQVVAAADAVLAALSPAQRMVAWRIDFGAQQVDNAFVGRGRAYLVRRQWEHGRRFDPPLELPDRRPVLRHDKQRYDEVTHVTCVDAATGKRVWSRRFAGFHRFTVDPRNDDFWAMASTILRLSAETGEVTLERALPPERARDVRGVRDADDGTIIAIEPEQPSVREPSPFNVLDLGTGVIDEIRWRPEKLSPNRLRVLRRKLHQAPDDVTVTFALSTLDGTKDEWTYPTAGYSANDPVWFGSDALVLSGMDDTRGAVTRLDGGSGQVRWVTLLPRGAYRLDRVYLASNMYLHPTWDAVGELAGHVAAIDGCGELVLLDPSSGEVRGRSTHAPAHLAMPREVGGNVVIASTKALLAVPVDAMLRRGGGAGQPAEREALSLKGRALLALGRDADARAAADLLTAGAPDDAQSWELSADVAARQGRGGDELIARVRAMELSGRERSETLLASHGLLARVATAPIRAELAPIGTIVYAGACDGTLTKIDAESLAVVERQRFAEDIQRLQISGNQLLRSGTNRHVEPVASFVRSIDPPAEFDELFADAQRRHDFDDPDREVQSDRALGLSWGPGGAWESNADGSRGRQIIDVGNESLNDRPHPVWLLAADEQTICLHVNRREHPVLQVWSRDGTRKLREEPAAIVVGYPKRARGRLIALREGYFFGGDELVWVPRDPQRPAWRFALWKLPRGGMRHQDLRDFGFGTPRVVGDKIFAACRDGGVFVFDIERLTRK